MGYPHYDLVQRAHSELVSEGKIKTRYNQEEVEQDKGLLTRRATYYTETERDPNYGLVTKDYGNNSAGYSVDIILHRDGTFYDVATDTGGMAMPVDGGPAGPDPELAQRWAPSSKELAGIDGQPGPGPSPPQYNYDEQLNAILANQDRAQEVQARDTASIIARSDLNTERILEKLDDIKDQAEETLKKFLVLWMAQREEGAPPEIPPGENPPSQLLLLLLKALGDRPPTPMKKGKKS